MELVIDPFDGSQDPHAHLQAFQTQVYINGANNLLSCKLFLGTLRGVAMRWFLGLPPLFVTSFADLATTFESRFAFNTAMVQVDDPDQKFFVKAFQKGLQASPFSDSLALSRLASMTKIRVQAKKHVEVEDLQVEKVILVVEKKNAHGFQTNHQYIPVGVS
ncbi:hypothetical protein CR513_02280, partial [Mucuna pruriens]